MFRFNVVRLFYIDVNIKDDDRFIRDMKYTKIFKTIPLFFRFNDGFRFAQNCFANELLLIIGGMSNV